MATVTNEELINEINERIGNLEVRDDIEHRVYEIALASLKVEVEPTGAFYIADQQVDGKTDYILVPLKPTKEMLMASELEQGADWQYSVDIWDSMCRAVEPQVKAVNIGPLLVNFQGKIDHSPTSGNLVRELTIWIKRLAHSLKYVNQASCQIMRWNIWGRKD